MDQQPNEPAPKVEWENDERGKPCKWVRTVTITAEELENAGGSKEAAALVECKESEVRAAFNQCQADLSELMATGEYIIIVSPETVRCRDMEIAGTKIQIRCRVRWLTPEARANRERNIEAMFGAVDDEWANGPT